MEENGNFLGEDDIMYIELTGECDVQDAFASRDTLMEQPRTVEGKVTILINNSASKKSTPEARKMFIKLEKIEWRRETR
jgi:hypothetical protein